MRALIIVLTDKSGGAERIATRLASCLSNRMGWTVDYRVLSTPADPSFSITQLPSSVRVVFGRSARPLLGLIQLPFLIIGRRYEVVISTHIYINGVLSALRACGLLRTERLVTRESTTVFDRYHGVKRWLLRFLYRLYGSQDLIVAQTAYMARHVAPHLPARARRRIQTLPNPVDLAAIDRGASLPLAPQVASHLAGRTAVLFCGRLVEVKQPLTALDAFNETRLRRPADNLQLVFAGDGPLRPFVEAEVVARGLENDVLFLGHQANPYAIMAACRYGLLTSSREGFPNVVLEMMACGLRKVVTTPCAGDLDSLTGVSVTRGFTATELASALVGAIEAGEDHSETYRALVAERSVERYLTAVLGEVHRGR